MNDWSNSTPTDTLSVKEFYPQVREMKEDELDRMVMDHYYGTSIDTALPECDGRHKQVTLGARNDAIFIPEDAGVIACQSIDGVVEFNYGNSSAMANASATAGGTFSKNSFSINVNSVTGFTSNGKILVLTSSNYFVEVTYLGLDTTGLKFTGCTITDEAYTDQPQWENGATVVQYTGNSAQITNKEKISFDTNVYNSVNTHSHWRAINQVGYGGGRWNSSQTFNYTASRPTLVILTPTVSRYGNLSYSRYIPFWGWMYAGVYTDRTVTITLTINGVNFNIPLSGTFTFITQCDFSITAYSAIDYSLNYADTVYDASSTGINTTLNLNMLKV